MNIASPEYFSLYNEDMRENLEEKGWTVNFTNYALLAAKRGKAMGRDSKHFFNEACKVIPQAEVDNDYRERYGKILEEYDPSKVEEDAFQYAIGRV